MKERQRILIGVYKIVNKQTGKLYIGSSNNIHKRWWEHRKWLRLGKHVNVHLQRAWNKDGEDSFEFVVTEELPVVSREVLRSVEQSYLDQGFALGQGLIYNISTDANIPDSSLLKISVTQIDSQTMKVVSVFDGLEEAAEKTGIRAGTIRSCCRGRGVTAGGFRWKYTEDEKSSQFQEKQGQHGGHGKQRIEQVDLITGKVVATFGSIAQAAAKNNIKACTITPVLKGRRKVVKGLVFKYEEEQDHQHHQTVISSTPVVCCKICNMSFGSYSKAFSTHLQMTHKLSSENYTIKYLTGFGQRPTCHALGCMVPVRYVAFTFKEFCKNHSTLAMSKGGKVGGCAPAWNQGLTKENDDRVLRQSLLSLGEGNPFYGHQHSDLSKEQISKSKTLTSELFNERLQSRAEEFFVSTPHSEYVSRQGTKLHMSCVVCGTDTTKTLQSFERGSLCKRCHPFTVSKAELEIFDFVTKELGFVAESGNRQLIAPLELDIYVPEKKVAIEYHGLYWHQDKKDLHLDKFNKCKEQGIQLVQVFSDEWLNQKELVQSMIANRLGNSTVSVGARECSLVEVTSKEAKMFFEVNHISGHTLSKKNFGLVFNNELVLCLSLRIPRHKQHVLNGKIEIARLATKMNHVVSGGFTKVLKRTVAWAKAEGHKTLMSYCDLRFGEGKVYLKNGFTLVNDNTGVNYWYTDGVQRYDRFKFRAQPNKPEAEVAKEANVHKIYGCGNSLYEMTL